MRHPGKRPLFLWGTFLLFFIVRYQLCGFVLIQRDFQPSFFFPLFRFLVISTAPFLSVILLRFVFFSCRPFSKASSPSPTLLPHRVALTSQSRPFFAFPLFFWVESEHGLPSSFFFPHPPQIFVDCRFGRFFFAVDTSGACTSTPLTFFKPC